MAPCLDAKKDKSELTVKKIGITKKDVGEFSFTSDISQSHTPPTIAPSYKKRGMSLIHLSDYVI